MQRPYGIAVWDLTTYLLATGEYRHPVPPDPISEIWHNDILDEDEPKTPVPESDSLAGALFGQPVQEYNYENPPDLPRQYDPDRGRRRARDSRKARFGSVKSYTLRVNHRALPEVWRDIELAEDNTLEDLYLTIQQAYGWWDDHLYSFFTQRRRLGSKQ
ncbi:MAG TPA: hypothetical protein VF177_20120 [Anaerolineae bacterium]